MNIWIYIAIFAFGWIGGMWFEERTGLNVVYKGKFKTKQRGRDNTLESTVNVRNGLKPTWKEKRRYKINEKKKRKAEKRLNSVN